MHSVHTFEMILEWKAEIWSSKMPHLHPLNWRIGIKFADRIKIVNHLTLTWADYLKLSKWSPRHHRTLTFGRGKLEEEVVIT